MNEIKCCVDTTVDLKKNLVSIIFSGYGVKTDLETRDHAKIMLFSVIPFIIILIPKAFDASYSYQEYNFVVLISLIVAVFCLSYYFRYQVYINFPHIRVAYRII